MRRLRAALFITRRRARALSLLVTAAALLAVAPAALAAAPTYTWTGQGAQVKGASSLPDPYWSDTSNWSGAMAPAASAEQLEFGALSQCPSTTQACETSKNDLTGVTTQSISIADQNYTLTGNPVSLGAGGISAGTDGTTGPATVFDLPLTLTASQTWTIGGNGQGAGLRFDGTTASPKTPLIYGSGQDLTVNLSSGGVLQLGGDAELGSFTAQPQPYAPAAGTPGGNGVIEVGGNLNGATPAPVAIKDVELDAPDGTSTSATTGPLRASGAALMIGGNGAPGSAPGTLSVQGGVAMNSTTVTRFAIGTGTAAGTDYSELMTGPQGVAGLAGTLSLTDNNTTGACPVAATPDILISAPGGVISQFSNASNGTVLTFAGGRNEICRARIVYTSDAVEAVMLSPSSTTLTTQPAQSGQVNQTVTLIATVTAPDKMTPSGTVNFEADGQTIPGCGNVPVQMQATCSTQFAAAGQPTLTAIFTADQTSPVTDSTSPGVSFTVTPAPAATGHSGSGPGTGSGSGSAPAPGTGSGSGSAPAPAGPGGGSAPGGSSAPGHSAPCTPRVVATRTSGTSVIVSLAAAGSGSCTVKLALSTVERVRVHAGRRFRLVRRTVTLATATATVRAGRRSQVKVSLNAGARKLLVAQHRLMSKLTVATPARGKSRTVATRTIRFTAQRAKKRK